MQAYVNIGANCEFKLSEAVLIYRGGGEGAFASLHQVKQAENGIPYLAPGEALTTAFVRTLAQGLGAQVKPEIFPENVLARTPDLLVWWSRPQRRVMFFGGTDEEARKINGLVFPHPALIFKVAGKDLFVRAMATTSRPRPRNAPEDRSLLEHGQSGLGLCRQHARARIFRHRLDTWLGRCILSIGIHPCSRSSAAYQPSWRLHRVVERSCRQEEVSSSVPDRCRRDTARIRRARKRALRSWPWKLTASTRSCSNGRCACW